MSVSVSEFESLGVGGGGVWVGEGGARSGMCVWGGGGGGGMRKKYKRCLHFKKELSTKESVCCLHKFFTFEKSWQKIWAQLFKTNDVVNTSLKPESSNMAYMLIFLLKNVTSFCICKNHTFFQQTYL